MPLLDELNPSNGPLTQGLFTNKFGTNLSTLENQSGVFINNLCFNEGTLILTLNSNNEDVWVEIEKLQIGQLVKTYLHGYRKVKHLGKGILKNNVAEPLNCMYKITKNNNNIFKDLIITGGHSILVDTIEDNNENMLNLKYFNNNVYHIDDKLLLLSCASKNFIQIDDVNEYTYYHFVLENDGDINKCYGVWANGILTETPSEKFFLSNLVYH